MKIGTTRFRTASIGALAVAVLAAVFVYTTSSHDRSSPGAPEHRASRDEVGREGDGPRLSGTGPRMPSATISMDIRVLPLDAPAPWTVELLAMGSIEARSPKKSQSGTGDARVTFEVPLPGTYLVRLLDGRGAEADRTTLTVESGAKEVVTLKLLAPGKIVGKALNALGAPARGAIVSVAPVRPREGMRPVRRQRGVVETQVAEDGSFVIGALEPAITYDVAAVGPGYQVERELGVTVEPGSERALEFVLRPAARLIGRIVSPAGEPIAGLNLTLQRIAERDESSLVWDLEGRAVTRIDGTFVFESLSPGEKKLVATPTYALGLTEIVQRAATCEAGHTTDLGTIAALDGELRIQLHTIGSARVPESTRVRVTAVPEAHSDSDVMILYVFLDADGRGVVRGLPRGRVDLLVTASAGEMRARARSSFDFAGGVQAVTLHMGDSGQPVEPGGGLRVRVVDIQPGGFWMAWSNDRIFSSSVFAPGSEDQLQTIRSETEAELTMLLVSGGKYSMTSARLDPHNWQTIELRPVLPGRVIDVRLEGQEATTRPLPVTLRLGATNDSGGAIIGHARKGLFQLNGFPRALSGSLSGESLASGVEFEWVDLDGVSSGQVVEVPIRR